MFHRWIAALTAFGNRLVSGPSRLNQAVRQSLNPANDREARILQAQLDLVRKNVSVLDYAFPLAGLILVSLHAMRSGVGGPLFAWAVVMVASAANEIVILRRSTQSDDVITRARDDAKTIPFAIFCLLMAWGTFCFSLWAGSTGDGHLLTILVLACSLAAASSLLAWHATAAIVSLVTISAFTLGIELVSGYGKHLRLFQLLVLYVTMIVAQACTNHARFNKSLRLEQDRELLIENLRQAKIEADRAHAQAVAASKAKSEFLANMSHELRTPLNAIIGFSDIVRTRAFGDSDKYPEYGGFIHQSGHHLLSLISDILDLAKIEAGRKGLLAEPIDITGVVLDEVRLAEEKAAAKGVSVVPVLPRHLPLLNADIHAVRQILNNLVSNAVKYTPSGGSVEVSLALNAAGEIELCVSDTGIGIAPQDQTQLFDRLGHGRSDIITTVERGTGLGLPIVKGLVEMHGGRVNLDSELGQGTRMTVIFPAESTIKTGKLLVA
jgi:two-component system, cell cycle sensor histidine kinase PleC